jgi:hypothetical protein
MYLKSTSGHFKVISVDLFDQKPLLDQLQSNYLFICFLAALGLELRASLLLSRHLSLASNLFCFRFSSRVSSFLPNLLLLRQENREALFSQDGGGA